MGNTYNVLLAGFGGQGILFAGKIMANAGFIEDKQLSWLPSYGPEMRGGTCNCSVCLSDEPIGSPLVLEPNVLLAMNQPSLDKFAGTVEPGGVIVYDSSMIPNGPTRTDIKAYAVPATKIADDNDLKGLANVIMVGKLWKETGFCSEETLDAAIAKVVPPKKQHLLEPNRKALALGKEA
jgi:2-oxoglutarate ferredoxin oxidoreductase subunit gamma